MEAQLLYNLHTYTVHACTVHLCPRLPLNGMLSQDLSTKFGLNFAPKSWVADFSELSWNLLREPYWLGGKEERKRMKGSCR